MNKKELFFLDAPYVKEDGTYDELLDVFLKHPQTDPNILERACKDISEYINFSMNVCVDFYCPKRKTYTFDFPKGYEPDLSKWEIYIFSYQELVTNETTDFFKYNYPNLEKMIKMFRFEKRPYNELTEEEKEKKKMYPVPYGFLFSTLLDGVSF